MQSVNSIKKEIIVRYLASVLAVNLCAAAVTGCSLSVGGSGGVPEVVTSVSSVRGGVLEAETFFSSRDLIQSVSAGKAIAYTVEDGQTISITREGVYLLRGEAAGVTVTVDAGSKDKVQLVLDGVRITNTGAPCVYVRKAAKTYVTLLGDNELSATGAFAFPEDSKADGVIFSREPLVLNGTGSLTLSSSRNGIVGRDSVKMTGGTYRIQAGSKAIAAHDAVCIAAGQYELRAGTDGIHAEHPDDGRLGYVLICGGKFDIRAEDDGIHAGSVLQIDNGTFSVAAWECLEGTYVQINNGTLSLESKDDGINAARKSDVYTPTVDIAGGSLSIRTESGEADAVDSNGDIRIRGGRVDITAHSPFDYDGNAAISGGEVTVNGRPFEAFPLPEEAASS